MSLMHHAIRPKPPQEDDEDNFEFDIDKIYEKAMAEYKKAFPLQRSLQEKEIGSYFPVKAHRLLLKAVSLPEKTKSGLLIPDAVRDNMVRKYDIGLVVGAGPEAYMEKRRFPAGPRCKIGDWVDFSPFEKQHKTFDDHLCYFIDDDRVNAVIPTEYLKKVVPELRQYE